MASAGTSRRVPDRPRSPRTGSPAERASTPPATRPVPTRSRGPGSRPAGRDGRPRPTPSAPPSVRRPQTARLHLEHAVHDPRVGDEERLDPRPGQEETAQRPGGDDIGDRSLPEEDRDLAEE